VPTTKTFKPSFWQGITSKKENDDSVEINVLLSSNEGLENTAHSKLWMLIKLIDKKLLRVFDKNKKALVSFSLPAKIKLFLGRNNAFWCRLDYDQFNLFYIKKKG